MFKHASVRPQEDLHVQFYGISFIRLYQAHPAIDQAAYMDAWKKYKTACTSLPEDEHWDVRNMSKTLSLN